VNEIFEKVYNSKKNGRAKQKFVNGVFSTCNRSSFVDLKINIAKSRASGMNDRNQSGAVND